jgi:ubiquinone/menaquinone biosynthesis C-methylase UbiE
MTTYDRLAEHYAVDRLGYSNDLYNTLLGFGLTPRNHVLDVGCGTGLGSRSLIENGVRVTGVDSSKAMLALAREWFPAATWIEGRAEALPFSEPGFDAAISAQAFHRFDKPKALAEFVRVLRPGGLVAIWWKVLMNDDPVCILRDDVARGLAAEPPSEGLSSGFKEFYAAPLIHQTLRVIPWHVTSSLRAYLEYERSRMDVYETFGSKTNEYLAELERRLSAHLGAGAGFLPLNYLQFVYVGWAPTG